MTSTKTQVGTTADFQPELGVCVKIEGKQIAVYYIPSTDQQWFAIDNFNPQNQRMVLSRGIIGSDEGIPFVACPLHKYRYALTDGKCLTDDTYQVSTYVVSVEGENVYITV